MTKTSCWTILEKYLFRLEFNGQKNSVDAVDNSVVGHHVASDDLGTVSIEVTAVGPSDRDEVASDCPLVGGVEEEDVFGDAGAAEVTLEYVVVDDLLGQGLIFEDLLKDSLSHALECSVGWGKEGERTVGVQFGLELGKLDQLNKLLILSVVLQNLNGFSTRRKEHLVDGVDHAAADFSVGVGDTGTLDSDR